jgi:hypothetical protein
MSVMVLDAGNSIIKAKITRRENGEIVFPHALKQLTESEYEKITNRSGLQTQSLDYLRINGNPYLAGESAEQHGLITQRTGTARYTRDNYGVLAAAALGRLYNRSREVSVFGSYPPCDVKFRHVMNPIQGHILASSLDTLRCSIDISILQTTSKNNRVKTAKVISSVKFFQ